MIPLIGELVRQSAARRRSCIKELERKCDALEVCVRASDARAARAEEELRRRDARDIKKPGGKVNIRKPIPITAHAYDKCSDLGHALHIGPYIYVEPKEQPMHPHYIRTERFRFRGDNNPAAASIDGYADKLSSLLYSEGQRVYKYVGEAKRIETPGEKIAPKVGDELRTQSGAIVRIVSLNGPPRIPIVGLVRNASGYEDVEHWHESGYPAISNHCGRLIFDETKPSSRIALVDANGNEVKA